MLDRLLFPVTFIAALGAGLIAGTFFAFSVFVMKALAGLPPAQGMAAMQSINAVILRTVFMPVFMGTALICLFTGVVAIMRWGQAGSGMLLTASVLYFVTNFVVTAALNVPLNDALAAADPHSAAGVELWSKYLTDWTLWNHVRTVGGLLAMVGFIMALVQMGND